MCSSGRGSWKSEFRILIAIGFGRERDGDGDGDGGGDPLVFAFSSHRLEESGGNKERNRRERERKSELVHIGGPTGGVSRWEEDPPFGPNRETLLDQPRGATWEGKSPITHPITPLKKNFPLPYGTPGWSKQEILFPLAVPSIWKIGPIVGRRRCV
eukprot:TRINITY_DN11584_c0_g1_i2.p1 TRINITY_DN11584_c0_g1~~TRINITY_DN11584_c0_g1_i2.p1  ORF type:complete len:156 (-),score=28.31 TRINITY_DN11584_c0_g1_i2:283-750(-)